MKLMAACRALDEKRTNPFLYLFALVTLDTGIRPGKELGCVLSLRWDNIDFNNRVIILPETKGGKRLIVPMSQRLHGALAQRHEYATSEHVFPSPDGRGKGGTGHLVTYWKPFKEALALAGLPTSIRPYDLRHTAATNMLMRGVPIQVVKRMLGHSSITVTQRYSHSTDSAERAAAEILGGIGEGPTSVAPSKMQSKCKVDGEAVSS
jgi:integrase